MSVSRQTNHFCAPFATIWLLLLATNLLAAQILHEFGHWLVLSLYGRGPIWGITSMVQLWDRLPQQPGLWVEQITPEGSSGWLRLSALPADNMEWVLFLVAGPLAQVLGSALGFWLWRRSRRQGTQMLGFAMMLVNGFGLFFYELVSLLRGGGSDETLLAYYTGVPRIFIMLAFAGCAALALYYAVSLLPAGRLRRHWLGALVLATIPIGPLLMLLNQQIMVQVDAGQPFFQPVLGFSLPVVLLALTSSLLIVILLYRWDREAAPVTSSA